MSTRIFKSPEAREQLLEWSRQFEAKLESPVEHLEVEIAHGSNHVLALGDPANTPLVCLHGARTTSAHAAVELEALADRFYLLLPDVPGHSVRGPEVVLPREGAAWANWATDIIDALDIGPFHLIGVSWGGFIALETASSEPGGLQSLTLIVPAGVVRGAIFRGLIDIVGPLAMYKLFPSEARLRNFMEPMMTTWDDDWAHYIADAMQSYEQTLRSPPRVDSEKLASIEVPTLVFAGTDDLTVPGERLIDHLDTVMPHAKCELLEGCKHIPPTTDAFRQWVAERLTSFIAKEKGTEF